MLTCKEQVARSSDYLDGQLSFRERLMVRHHLMFCPNCRRFIRQMRLMQATLTRHARRNGAGRRCAGRTSRCRTSQGHSVAEGIHAGARNSLAWMYRTDDGDQSIHTTNALTVLVKEVERKLMPLQRLEKLSEIAPHTLGCART